MDVDLFSQTARDLDQSYIALRDATDGADLMFKHHCEQLWSVFQPYADRQFVREFSLNLSKRYWEMYLGCTLLDVGLELLVSDSDQGPDFHFSISGRDYWVEAIAPGPGELSNADRVPDLMVGDIKKGVEPVTQELPREQIILRLSQALQVKADAFKRYVEKGIVGPDDVRIIAVNGADLGRWGDSVLPLILTPTYGVGQLTATFGSSYEDPSEQSNTFQEHIQKSSGTVVPMCMFLSEEYAHVSGVLYDRRGLGAYRGRLGCEFRVVPNEFALAPMPANIIRRGWEYTVDAVTSTLNYTDWEA